MEDTSENNRNEIDITDEQRNILLQFMEITAKESEDECIEIISKFNWNLEAAVQNVLNEGMDYQEGYDIIDNGEIQQHSARFADHTPYSAGQNVVEVHRRNAWSTWLSNLVYFPLDVVHASYAFTYHCVTEFFFFIARIIWPNFGRVSTNPVDDIVKFKTNYESTYGNRHPTFYLGSYSQVLSDAKKELRFLLVYLHSEEHADTPKFCREVLSNEGFIEYVNGNMLFWGCDVKTNEGFRVSRAMRETSYPFLAVVCLRENRMTIVWKIQGLMNVDELIAVCAQVINDNEPSLIAARAERQERNVTQELRSEQDAAYLESLAKDRQKEEEKERLLEEAKKEEENKMKKENEKLKRIKDLESKRKEANLLFQSLTEPSPKDENSLQIRIKLPSGTQLQRYFLKSDKLQLLYDFVYSHEESSLNFLINTTFPRKTFPLANNENKTLVEMGLVSNITILVQNIDEDSSDEEDDED